MGLGNASAQAPGCGRTTLSPCGVGGFNVWLSGLWSHFQFVPSFSLFLPFGSRWLLCAFSDIVHHEGMACFSLLCGLTAELSSVLKGNFSICVWTRLQRPNRLFICDMVVKLCESWVHIICYNLDLRHPIKTMGIRLGTIGEWWFLWKMKPRGRSCVIKSVSLRGTEWHQSFRLPMLLATPEMIHFALPHGSFRCSHYAVLSNYLSKSHSKTFFL